MSKLLNFLSLIGSNARYFMKRKYNSVGSTRIIDSGFSVNTFMEGIQKKNVCVAHVNELTTLIIYDRLLIKQKLKEDYSILAYALVSKQLNINSHELSFKVMDHIGNLYVRNFAKSDLVFIPNSRRNRYIIKCLHKEITFFHEESLSEMMQYLPVYLNKKKVMIISEYSDLVKVQFVRSKANPSTKEQFDYSLKAVNPQLVIASTDRSLYFESLDELRMKVLELSFDVCLIREDVYSLALSSFITELGIPCFILDDSLYSLFNIVKTKRQLCNADSTKCISLEDYDSQENEDFKATVFLSKEDIRKNIHKNTKK